MANDNSTAFIGWGVGILIFAGLCFQIRSCALDKPQQTTQQTYTQPQNFTAPTKPPKIKKERQTPTANATPEPKAVYEDYNLVNPTPQPTRQVVEQPRFVPPVQSTPYPTPTPQSTPPPPRTLLRRMVTCGENWTNTGVTLSQGQYLVLEPQDIKGGQSYDFTTTKQESLTVYGQYRGSVSTGGMLFVRSRDRLSLLVRVLSDEVPIWKPIQP